MPEKKNMPYNKICFILKTVYSHEVDEEDKKIRDQRPGAGDQLFD
tara:strand:+ start:942 stop:1076 length:135 start_codon:yes stop_codon:yes gene_type:complete